MKCFLESYKIAEQQFGITPDRHFLDLGRTSREGLAFVFHGIAAGRGFRALISRSGLDKTALLRPLSQMVREPARTAFLFQSQSIFGSSVCRQQGDMSKSFELMRQQMEKKLDVLPAMEQNVVPRFVHEKRDGYARITRLDLDRATPEEYRKLAENIVRSRGKKSPRVVTLAGIVFGKRRSRISAHPCGLADALHTKVIEIYRPGSALAAVSNQDPSPKLKLP